MTSTQRDAGRALRQMQMIAVALILGLIVFAAIAAFAGPIGTPLEPIVAGLDPLAMTAALVTISCAAMSFFVPPRLVGAIASDTPEHKVAAFRSGRIVALALCEGPAVLWAVATLLSGNRWFLAPIAVLVALMVFHFPTSSALHDATGQRADLDGSARSRPRARWLPRRTGLAPGNAVGKWRQAARTNPRGPTLHPP